MVKVFVIVNMFVKVVKVSIVVFVFIKSVVFVDVDVYDLYCSRIVMYVYVVMRMMNIMVLILLYDVFGLLFMNVILVLLCCIEIL